MNRAAIASLSDVDGVLWVIEALHWTFEDEHVLQQLKQIKTPVMIVINKIDTVKNKAELLPFIENVAAQLSDVKIFPLSAKTGLAVDALQSAIEQQLPHTGESYPPEQLTDRSHQFICTEFIREKLTRTLGDELPYALTVTVDIFEATTKMVRIAAVIWVEKNSQKAIVIGKGGAVLKKIGTQARKALENYFEKKVLLKLWVKVKENWADDARALGEFGYGG